MLLLLLAVEDQAGDEVAAEAEELGLGFVAAVACGFFGGPLACFAAVTAAGSEGAVGPAEVKGTGIAIAIDAKGVVDVSACSGSEQRDDGSAEGEGSGGEGVEGHDGEVIVESPSGSG